MLVSLKMAENVKVATLLIQHGHIRVGPEGKKRCMGRLYDLIVLSTMHTSRSRSGVLGA